MWHKGQPREFFANTAGGDFTPHVINVATGEDVAAKIFSLSHKGPRGICIAANGAVSNVTIRQPGSSGGSFTVSENGGIKCRSGGLSVSLAAPDGRVVGGGLLNNSDKLIAYCIEQLALDPRLIIQIVVGSFMPNGYKTHKKKHQYEPRMAPANQVAPDVTAATPISQAAPVANNYPTPTSQVQVQSYGVADNTASNKEKPNSTSSDTAVWNGLAPTSDQRPSPDINVSAPEE
ncbi:hypothetical protein RJ640_030980 [Escallonia rubra]|uniref:AT-hook motif nuclear-localized protein n=1 Tax=Escallonia rubra TaxID=112253 RepID=A0AA88R8S3_9ASTE|nr:hypothetical protein RJ640_030980 [Escallonia rubra]